VYNRGMSAEISALIVVVAPTPERIAARTNITDRLIEDTTLSKKTLTASVTRQKIDALTDVVEMAAAKDELNNYLWQGETHWGHKNGEVRYVDAAKMRELTLKAGYTELALSVMARMGATDLEVSEHFPQPDKDKMTINLRTSNRYGLKPGNYDALDAVNWIINTAGPDYPSGRDPLRRRVLKEIDEVKKVKRKLAEQGKTASSLSTWDMGKSGKTYFLLNPGYENREAEFGWYTASQLRGWVNGNPRSTVLKENQKKTEFKDTGRAYWKTRLAEHLGRLSKRRDTEGKRMFRMALMDCPFDDLRERYSQISSK
jgi:hypothetical protein